MESPVDMGAGTLAMAKRGRGRPKGERDDVTVKMDRSLKHKVDLLATHRGVSVAALVSELIAAPLDRAYLEIIRDLERTKPGAGK
jgi:hypothetical protein